MATSHRWVKAWGRLVQWSDEGMRLNLKMAADESAPPYAIYKSTDGEWKTLRDIDSVYVLMALNIHYHFCGCIVAGRVHCFSDDPAVMQPCGHHNKGQDDG